MQVLHTYMDLISIRIRRSIASQAQQNEARLRLRKMRVMRLCVSLAKSTKFRYVMRVYNLKTAPKL